MYLITHPTVPFEGARRALYEHPVRLKPIQLTSKLRKRAYKGFWVLSAPKYNEKRDVTRCKKLASSTVM